VRRLGRMRHGPLGAEPGRDRGESIGMRQVRVAVPHTADVIGDTRIVADCLWANVVCIQYGPNARIQTSGDRESGIPKPRTWAPARPRVAARLVDSRAALAGAS
jgi:hypothetical protein